MYVSPERAVALELLKKYNKEPFHIQHALTVEGTMRWYAQELGYGEDMEADKDITTFSELLNRGTSFTKNDNTPMGNHYDNRHQRRNEQCRHHRSQQKHCRSGYAKQYPGHEQQKQEQYRIS